MLDRLEAKGLLYRTIDKKNRRQIRIVLSDMAKSLENKYNAVSDEMSEIFYRGFSDEEINELESKLNLILKNLNEKGETL